MLKLNSIICVISCLVAIVNGSELNSTYKYVRIHNKMYHFAKTEANWYQAFLDCRSLGGFLASIDSDEEMTQLDEYIKKNFDIVHRWWLSGSDLAREGAFQWFNNGERVLQHEWLPHQPDNHGAGENCIHLWHLHEYYRFNDAACKGKFFYICEAKIPEPKLECNYNVPQRVTQHYSYDMK